ncbi:peroxisomal coenzyme A diphosphatase NUDT7 isoform X2 [Syngnathus typhle]|uniref:peroxisomal coenzyme A diphosphatase NUDT7 isoform X2 n=1 Tax=Syngnathus typhle TaxID=161592 RepID=UPI002A6B6C8A|nr:peroxisomal coenzyme A diphosphatase NUDT7 isoform X2 [Syngnathus typhle]
MDVKETMAAFKPFDVRKQADILGEAELPQASVLVPLFMRSGKLHTLMTQRSEQLRVSAGEVCFPGGKRDSSDKDAVHTALREAHEEIGLPPGDVHVICTLQPFITKNSLLVTPVVGFIPESFLACPNTAEVDKRPGALLSEPKDVRTKQNPRSTSVSTAHVTRGSPSTQQCSPTQYEPVSWKYIIT